MILNGIYYEIKNNSNKETLVFLHGNNEDHHIYDEVTKYFNNYRLVLIDSRLHGQSEKEDRRIYLKEIVNDIINILNLERITKATFIGFSDGGNIALLLSIMYPTYVNKIVIMGANYCQTGLKWNYLLANYGLYTYYSIMSMFKSEYRIKKWICTIMTLEPNIKDDDLSRINCPTLIITSKKDCIRLKHSQKMAKLIKKSNLVLIKNSSHFFLKDNLEDTVKAIINFLN